LIREVLRARKLEDFAIPGVIPPTDITPPKEAKGAYDVDRKWYIDIYRIHK
jgi:hypothetical protein